MKKDLILITAYCDNSEKLNLLRNLVTFFKKSDKYDTLVSSHSVLPEDIVKECDYFFYDSKNILLEDYDLRSAAWFDPDGQGPINSIFTGFYNTHLAVWRLIIFGNQIAKNLGYNKIHHIEYDTEVIKTNEIDENSELLNSYDVITYNISDHGHQELLLGSYQSYNVNKIPKDLIEYNEDRILNTIRNSLMKSPEVFLKSFLHENTKFLEKKIYERKINGIFFGISNNDPNHPAWCVPYYDNKTDKLFFIVWNMEGINENINVRLIYNKEKIVNIEDVKTKSWRLIELGNYNNSQELVVILNNKIRNIYNFDLIRESFKYYSYR